MAQKDPLLLVLNIATEAENQAALLLQAAQLDEQKFVAQLTALKDYRLDYMQQMQAKQDQVVHANHYQQFHRFIAQIDNAIKQQHFAVAEGKKRKQQELNNWLEKQKKRKAVELLLKNKHKKQQIIAQRQEQKMSDEFTSQQSYRRQPR